MRLNCLFFVAFSFLLITPAYSAQECSHSEFHGTISKYPINMTIDISCDGDITGNYSYQKYKKPIPLHGKLPKQHNWHDSFRIDAEDETFLLSLNEDDYCMAGNFSGTWKNHDNEPLPVNLILDKFVKTQFAPNKSKVDIFISPSSEGARINEGFVLVNNRSIDINFPCDGDSFQINWITSEEINNISITVINWGTSSWANGNVDLGSTTYVHPNGSHLTISGHLSHSGEYEYTNDECTPSISATQLTYNCSIKQATKANLPDNQVYENEQKSEEIFNVTEEGFIPQSKTSASRSLTHLIGSPKDEDQIENQPWIPDNK